MRSFVSSVLAPLASLRLTVILLACAMVLVFAGTWAQIDRGIWDVQRMYFHSFYVWIDFQLFLPRPDSGGTGVPGGFPMVGGYSLIGLLVLNLLAAHALRFKLTFKRAGINLLHAGLILLLLGEVFTSLYSVEGQMTIREGETRNYSEDVRSAELAIIDASLPDHDEVTAIPQSLLRTGALVTHASLPFAIRVEEFYSNSSLLGPFQAQQQKMTSRANSGEAKDVVAVAAADFSGSAAEASSVNIPSAYVTLRSGSVDIGTYVVSVGISGEQSIDIGGKPYRMALRFRRDYKPYTINLIKFRHDKFTGSEMARNFSSQVRLNEPTRGEAIETIIRMNEPLRYRGETMYQSGFDENDPTLTTLTIVRNPGWLLPYASCTMVAAGMLFHFGITLLAFLRRAPTINKRTAVADGAGSRSPVLIPMLAASLCAAYLAMTWWVPGNSSSLDLNSFARIPISYEGRVMPIDSLARNSLRIVSGRSDFTANGVRLPATQWLLDTMAHSPAMLKHAVIRIDHPDIKNFLTLDASRKLFSYGELAPRLRALDEQVSKLSLTRRQDWTPYQHQINALAGHILLIHRLADVDSLYLIPPSRPGGEWTTPAALRADSTAGTNSQAQAFDTLLSAYANGDTSGVNQSLAACVKNTSELLPEVPGRSRLEVSFNQASPFYQLMIVYLVVFILICVSWLVGRRMLQRTAFGILLVALVYHTVALAIRIHLSGRPPVTNLYSSAIFIAWGAAVFCAVLEKIYKNGIGTLAAAFVAFPSLLIAHYLAGSGDTMQMLQAVLDTNFWLATHVVVITLGYSATFLAGMLAVIYVVGGVFTRLLANEESRKAVARMIYGILCFAMLFSFVGTILGGIWADQSWGRFWGWDPKENGAVLIVIWNALILHARWGGLVKARGIALLAIAGNAITSFSWFGTNMLGIGLHSYGFMDGAIFWLGSFIALQLLLIAIGLLPTAFWKSNQGVTVPQR